MKEEYKKYLPVIGLVVCGGLLLIIIFNNYSGSITKDGSSKTYQKSLSLDKLYDEAGGNDPLSNARLTSDINLSSDTQSCKFQVIYEGNNKREVNCIQGCDGGDEQSDFCNKYKYPDGELGLNNPLLDQTFVNRRRQTDSRNRSSGD